MEDKVANLTIVIVNWNSGEFLGKCIRSLYSATISDSFRIIIVDNGSTDQSMKNIPVSSKETVVRSETNLGFAKACNIGASMAQGKYILFLNPDTEVIGDSIDKAINILATKSHIGIVGVRQVTDDGVLLHSCSRFFRLKNLLNDVTGLTKLFPLKFKPSTIMFDWDHSASGIVDQVMGSFMLLRRADFESQSGFDERFFVYFEEMDLAKRFFESNLLTYYYNDAFIIHHGGGSSEKVKDKRLFYNLTSRILYSRKHFNKFKWMSTVTVTVLIEPFSRLINSIFITRNRADIANIIRGYVMIFKWIVR